MPSAPRLVRGALLLALLSLAACQAPMETTPTPPAVEAAPDPVVEREPPPPWPVGAWASPPAALLAPFIPDPAPMPAKSAIEARLVAILTGSSTPKAMFVDQRGFGHIFGKGDAFWGGGKIEDIREGEVEIAVGPRLPSGGVAPTPYTVVVKLHP